MHHRRRITAPTVGLMTILMLLVVSSRAGTPLNFQRSKKVPPPVLTTQNETPEEVTICQLTDDPGKYNHKLVKVTGFFTHGFEESSVFDADCSSRWNVWFEYGGKNVTGTMYCCGLTNARTRPKPIWVEKISIPLVVDENFKMLDGLLHTPPDRVVRGTVIGRFFSGTKRTAANGKDWWQGYGHMGCCSLLMIQQVLKVEPHDRSDLDYRATADYPSISQVGCGYKHLTELDRFPSRVVDSQKRADNDGQTWRFEDSLRVAVETISEYSKKDASTISGVRLRRQSQGRMVYEWRSGTDNADYLVVVSRPYFLSFYAKTNRIAWVPTAAYKSSCGPDNSVRLIKQISVPRRRHGGK